MGYRLPDRPPGEDKLKINDVATKTDINVDNGTISRIAFPCVYSRIDAYNRDIEDHIGWPSPGHPDRSGQEPHRFGFEVVHEPIEFSLEGYDTATVSTPDQPDGVTVDAFIDDEVVTIEIDAMCPDAIESDVSFAYALYVSGTATEYGDDPISLRDLITKGTIRIVAGVIDIDEPSEP